MDRDSRLDYRPEVCNKIKLLQLEIAFGIWKVRIQVVRKNNLLSVSILPFEMEIPFNGMPVKGWGKKESLRLSGSAIQSGRDVWLGRAWMKPRCAGPQPPWITIGHGNIRTPNFKRDFEVLNYVYKSKVEGPEANWICLNPYPRLMFE